MPVDFAPLSGGSVDVESGWKSTLKLASIQSADKTKKIAVLFGMFMFLLTFILACAAISSTNSKSAEILKLQKQVKSLKSTVGIEENNIDEVTSTLASVQALQNTQSASISSLKLSIAELSCTDYIGTLVGGEIKEFEGRYYQLVSVPWHIENNYQTGVTFHDAQLDAAARCHNGQRGYLATITSAEEQAFLESFLPTRIDNPDWTWIAWLGASDENQEGKWIWIDGPEQNTQFWSGLSWEAGGYPVNGAYTNWYCRENPNWDYCDPNGVYPSDQDCMQMYANGKWNDVNCDIKAQAYFVEYDVPDNLFSYSASEYSYSYL